MISDENKTEDLAQLEKRLEKLEKSSRQKRTAKTLKALGLTGAMVALATATKSCWPLPETTEEIKKGKEGQLSALQQKSDEKLNDFKGNVKSFPRPVKEHAVHVSEKGANHQANLEQAGANHFVNLAEQGNALRTNSVMGKIDQSVEKFLRFGHGKNKD